MIKTGKLLYRPEGWTSEALFYPIDVFAERANKSRRQIDRHIEAGELTKVMWKGLSWIPVHELQLLGVPVKEWNDDFQGSAEHATTGASAQSEAETASETGRAS